MNTRLLTALALLVTLCSVPARAASVEVDAEGSGPTREAAVAAGLVAAIQQATGVAVTSVQQMRAAMAASATGDGASAVLTEESQAETRRTGNGIVRSYRVLGVDREGPAEFAAHLSVSVEVFRPNGLGNDSRRRIAVAAFTEPGGARGLGALMRDRVTAALTRARRFAVVDRANDAAYANEMTALADAPLTERVRAGQVIGADYVLVGVIRSAAVSHHDETIELTGERIHSASSAVEADFQVIEIATRQVKWADTVRFTANGDDRGGLLQRAAERIAGEVTQTIYPMRLIRFDDPKELIINQGGDTVRPGQRLRAMLLGEALVDPYTKESLGQTERELGIIEIQRVDPKVSYARLVSGALPPPGSEIVLRPASAIGRPPARPAAPHRVIVKLPGDP